MPQETIIFNGANYRQNIKVELQENSNFFSWDINRFGRTARGEKYTRGDWQSNTEIWQQGIPLWIERQWLPGNEETFYNLNGLAGQSVIGTLLWVGQPPAPEILVKIRHLWENRATQSEAGVTTLVKGILCRYRGNSTTEVRQWFVDVWHLLRLNYLGRGKIVSRVWQL
jgi:urease accessory protein